MRLTDEQIRDIGEILVRMKYDGCLLCGAEALKINPRVLLVDMYGVDRVVPCVHVQCSACGRVDLFNADALGIAPPDGASGQESD